MGAGMYHIRVVGELDSTKIRAELARLSKTKLMVGVGGGGAGGGKGGKGNGIVQLGKDAEQTSKRLKGLNGQVIQNDKTLKGMHRGFANTSKEVEKSNSKLKTFGNESLNVTKKVVQFGAITAVIRGVTSGMGDMVQKTFELDAALTEFKKVSDLSGKGLDRYTDKAFKMGRSVAKTGTEMIEAATEFRKSGFNDQDSLKLGQVAMMFSNIADSELSAGDAAGFITSQIKANFNDVSNDATKASQQIIDAINEVSNTQAVSSTDLSMAMSKVGSAMKVNNNTYAQSLGMVTAGTEIMHGQASKVGRGLRTIGANISKMQKDAKTLDVQTKDGVKTIDLWDKKTNQVKSTYEVFKEFAGVWDDMTPDQQQALSLQMAGKNQQEVFASVIGNWKNAEKAAETAAKQINEGGSAAKENAKYLESMQGHLENLKSAWSEFSNAMMSSSALNKGMDILASILRFLASDGGKAVITLGLLTTGLNLFAKAALGLKGLSLVKLFSGLGKEARLAGGLIGETAVKSSKLDKVFSLLLTDTAAWAIGIAGASAAISAGLIVYDKYMQKHDAFAKSEAEDIKATKEYKKATEDLVKIQERLQGVQSEIEQLKQKRENGTLTETEKKRLDLLLEQENSLKHQLELQEKLIRHKFEDSEKKLGKSGLTSTDFANGRGKTAQEIWADKGVYNEADKAVYLYNKSLKDSISLKNKAKKAQDDYDEALRKGNATQDELDDLEKKATQAQKAYEDSQYNTLQTLDSLYNKKKEYLDVYGDEKSIPEELKGSYKKLNKVIRDNENLMDVSTDNIKGGMKAIKKYGKSMGVIVDNAGKIDKVDLANFNQSMTNAGKSADDVLTYLQEIAAENPDVTFTLDGSEYTIDQLNVVDGQLQTLDGTVATTTLDAKDNVTPKEQKIKGHRNLGKATKMLGEKGGHKVNTTMGDLEKKKSLGKATKDINQKGAGSVERKLGSIAARNNLGTAIKSIHFSLSGAVGAAKKFLRLKKGIRHFAAGGQNDESSIFPNAEVNEQGFEIIQDADTGLMRVVNGGKRGTTRLGEGDSVFTHGQSVRMLRNAGLTEGDVIYGHGDADFGLFGIKKLQGFKKGKKKKKSSKKKNQEAYNKKYNAIKNSMESGLATLEYKKSYYNWTDSEFNAQYKKLFNSKNKSLKALNKSKTAKAKGVKKKTTLGTDIVRAYKLALRETASAKAKQGIESTIANRQGTASDLSAMLKAIDTADKAQKITADEAKQYRMEAYKKYVDYNLKQYENDKETYAKSLKLIKDYYAQGKLSGEDYQKYLDDLAKNQLEKEKKRLQEQQDLNANTYTLAKAYVQRQIDLLETENKEQEKQNDLVELQNNLAKARNQRVRIYKEGEGFVYEKDTEAIREATQALKEYQSSASTSEEALNPVLVQWQEVLKLFDEFEADYELKALENKVGSTVGQLFGSLGTNKGAWSNWIKQNLSTTQGISDVLANLDKLVDTNDIIKYLDGNGQVSQAIMNAAISNNTLPTTYAAAITQMAQGMSAGVNTAANLATQSSITAATSGAVVMGNATQYGNIYNFDNLVLPNVTNANEFINDLNNLSTTALQTSAQRG